jgi:hypothetical protein
MHPEAPKLFPSKTSPFARTRHALVLILKHHYSGKQSHGKDKPFGVKKISEKSRKIPIMIVIQREIPHLPFVGKRLFVILNFSHGRNKKISSRESPNP